jgi:hypothetical protein
MVFKNLVILFHLRLFNGVRISYEKHRPDLVGVCLQCLGEWDIQTSSPIVMFLSFTALNESSAKVLTSFADGSFFSKKIK